MEQIVAENVSKSYTVPPENGGRSQEKLQVLSGVSFRVEKNEFVSILGPSGCGKSTLLRLLAGLDRDYEGSIRVDDTDLKKKRVPVCYMLQKDYLMPWRTLMENVLLPAEIAGADLKKEAEAIRPMLKEFGLEAFENYRPHALSGGMRQRAALLRTYRMQGISCSWMSLSALWMRSPGCRCRTGSWMFGENTGKPWCLSPTISKRPSCSRTGSW